MSENAVALVKQKDHRILGFVRSPNMNNRRSIDARKDDESRRSRRRERSPAKLTRPRRSQSAGPSTLSSFGSALKKAGAKTKSYFSSRLGEEELARLKNRGDNPTTPTSQKHPMDATSYRARSNSFAHPTADPRYWGNAEMTAPNSVKMVTSPPVDVSAQSAQSQTPFSHENPPPANEVVPPPAAVPAPGPAAPEQARPALPPRQITNSMLEPAVRQSLEDPRTGDMTRRLGELERLVEAQKAMIRRQQDELQDKDSKLSALRKTVADVTSKAAVLPPQLVLFQTEKNLIDAWTGLGYEVHNFVMNYLKGSSSRENKDWAMSNKVQLNELTPEYMTYASDSKMAYWLMEALIWDSLHRFVFATSLMDGSNCWAGQFAGHLSKLSGGIAKRVHQNDETTQRVFHEWKSLSTNLLAMTSPPDRDRELVVVAEQLGELLAPFKPKSKTKLGHFQEALLSVVRAAVSLDEQFCGQIAWYRVWYPSVKCGKPYEPEYMTATNENATGRPTKFVIRPALCRTGGSGERYAEIILLVRRFVAV